MYLETFLNVIADGYAPFLSMSSRETFLNVSDQVVAAPGPGHYDVNLLIDGVRVSKIVEPMLYN